MKKRQFVLIDGCRQGRVVGVQKRTGLVHVKLWMGGTYLLKPERLEVY